MGHKRTATTEIYIQRFNGPQADEKVRDAMTGMKRDPVAEFLSLARVPRDNGLLEKAELFLRTQETDLSTVAVLEERPDDQPVALLKIADGEATLFSVAASQSRVHETYIGKIYDATITQVHAIADPPKTERVEIVGSRLAGTINLTYYTGEDRAALMEALREIVAPRS